MSKPPLPVREQPTPQDTAAAHTEPTPCTCGCTTCRKPRYWLWILGFLAFYVLSVIPVGLMLYTFKSEMGWDIFKRGGYHAYMKCIAKALEIPQN